MKQIYSKEVWVFGGLALAWIIAYVIFSLDKLQNGLLFPGGILTVLLECGLETSAIISLLSSSKHNNLNSNLFLLLFCFILPADFSYLIVHYGMKMNNGLLSFSITTLPYSIAYIFGLLGYWDFIKNRLAHFTKYNFVTITWLPVLFSIPVLFTILIPLMISYFQKGGWSFLLFELVFNSFFSMSFFFFAVISFAFSVNLYYSYLALGGILLQLGNWGIYSTLLNGDQYSLNEYEFLWLCGITALWYGVVFIRKLKTSRNNIEENKKHIPGTKGHNSIIIQQRQIIIGLISVTILIAVTLLHRNVWSYRIAFFGVAIGCYVSLFLGELLAIQIVYYSALFGKIVKCSTACSTEDEQNEIDNNEIPIELWQIYRSAFHNDILQHRVNLIVKENTSKIASQVAHDIRSPLVALENVVGNTKSIPEGDRILIRTAVNRIKDIANNLIQIKSVLHRAKIETNLSEPSYGSNTTMLSIQLLSSLIDPLLTEKRLEFRSKIGIDLEALINGSSYGIFSKIQPIEFKRVLSNLINNSVEAVGEKGRVTVRLSAEDGLAILLIRDNGKGIPPEILPKLCARGETHGKAGGSGLGLHHAKAAVESWGGGLDIESEVGKGTTVTLRLPLAQPPEWFVSKLEIKPGNTIVVLDDDTSIHQVWRGRFENLRVREHGIAVVHFSTPSELRDWVRDNVGKAKDALYLTDYELLGHRETGLGLVEELKLGERSILITSRYEEKGILEECLRLKVRMIPKGLAGFVPIELAAPQPAALPPDAVLIDDDMLVRMVWGTSAKNRGKRLQVFASPQEFLNKCQDIPKGTPLYVDSELGGGVKGEHFAKELHDKGFTSISLATGHPPENFAGMGWISKVVGKEPPWT